MLQSKTVDIIRSILSGRIRDLAGRSVEPTASPDMLTHLEEITHAYTDFSRNHSTQDDTATAFAALDLIEKSRKHLDDLDRTFENGAGKNSAAHRFIKGLISFTEHDMEVIEPAPNN